MKINKETEKIYYSKNPYKSLKDKIKSKEGRIRRNIMGKRIYNEEENNIIKNLQPISLDLLSIIFNEYTEEINYITIVNFDVINKDNYTYRDCLI